MNAQWSTPSSQPPLRAGCVQVWRLGAGDPCPSVLAPAERERAARMRAGLPREEFIAARAALRLLLSGVLGRPPGELVFQPGPHGKPGLVPDAGVSFNVAHSAGCVLVALSRARQVGVDVEALSREVEALELAEQHFHPAEATLIRNTSAGAARRMLFFRCWTRKEAVLKADGRGIATALGSFSAMPPAGPVHNHPVPLPGAGTAYLTDLPLGGDFAGAIAVPERDCALELYQLASPASL